MDEPTAIFNSYEHEFTQLIENVKQSLEADGTGSNGGKYLVISAAISHAFKVVAYLAFTAEAKKAALRRVEISLDEADDLVRRRPAHSRRAFTD